MKDVMWLSVALDRTQGGRNRKEEAVNTVPSTNGQILNGPAAAS